MRTFQAVEALELVAHAVDELIGRQAAALGERLQVDEHAAAIVAAAAGAGAADRGADVRRRPGRSGRCRAPASAASSIASKEMSAEASVEPMIRPVSSSGKMPLGDLHIEMHREHDDAEQREQRHRLVAQRHVAACARRRETIQLERAFDDTVEAVVLRVLGALRKCAQIIGVTVSDTTIETAMATTSVTENSRSMRPTTPPMNSTGMNAAISDTLIEMHGEADLARADERGLHRRHAAPRGCGTRSRS